MEHVISVTVRDKIATKICDTVYICGNSGFVVDFDFDSEWNEHDAKTARFIWEGKYTDVVFTGNRCNVPVISETYSFNVGVFAGNLSTSTPAYCPAKKSILCGSGVPAKPQEDVYGQIMKMINDGMLQGEDGEPGEKGEKGEPGSPGADGFSPTIDVSKEGKTTTLTITDKDGTKTATINDGEDGAGTGGTGGSAEVTAESITAALGYTPAQQSRYSQPEWGAEEGGAAEQLYSGTFVLDDGITSAEEAQFLFDQITIVQGNMYRVMWNDDVYEREAKTLVIEDVSITYIGNVAAAGVGEDTGEPFLIANLATAPGQTVIVVTTLDVFDADRTATVAISQMGVTYHKIPAAYVETVDVPTIRITVLEGGEYAVCDMPFDSVWDIPANDIARALNITFADGRVEQNVSSQVSKGELIKGVRLIQINVRGLYDPGDFYFAPAGYTFLWHERYPSALFVRDATYMPYNFPDHDENQTYLKHDGVRWTPVAPDALRADVLVPATADTLGAVKVGDGLTVDVDGVLKSEIHVEGKYELIETIMIDAEDVQAVERTRTPDGTAYKYKAVRVRIMQPAFKGTDPHTIKVVITGNVDFNIPLKDNETLSSYGTLTIENKYGRLFADVAVSLNIATNANVQHERPPSMLGEYGARDIDYIKLYPWQQPFVNGTQIQIWGVRANA